MTRPLTVVTLLLILAGAVSPARAEEPVTLAPLHLPAACLRPTPAGPAMGGVSADAPPPPPPAGTLLVLGSDAAARAAPIACALPDVDWTRESVVLHYHLVDPMLSWQREGARVVGDALVIDITERSNCLGMQPPPPYLMLTAWRVPRRGLRGARVEVSSIEPEHPCLAP